MGSPANPVIRPVRHCYLSQQTRNWAAQRSGLKQVSTVLVQTLLDGYGLRFAVFPKISGSENSCPNLGSSSWSPGQLSDLELMLLNLLRKLNSGDRHGSSIESLESEHGADPLFNPAMVLFDALVQVFAGSDTYSAWPGSPPFPFAGWSVW